MPKAKFHEIMSNVKGVLDYSEFKNVDMVIEVILGVFFSMSKRSFLFVRWGFYVWILVSISSKDASCMLRSKLVQDPKECVL